MRRIITIIAAIFVATVALTAEQNGSIKSIYTEVTNDATIKFWVSYRVDFTEVIDLDVAIESAQKDPPFKAFTLDNMYVENITEWGFSSLVEKLFRKHSYIVVQMDNVGAWEFYNIGNNEMLAVCYKKQ